ncbi:MAG: NAD(P)-dependent glycerol-3-phosphate dehydrogenase [Chlamydiia bacterium]|nr:NAD(P)-dependent glycerol-3-phosphate dehydrogenase [Chlamydiia bacterium]
MKKIGYLGCGAWGFCLQRLLAKKGFQVVAWTIDPAIKERLSSFEEHPSLPGETAHENMRFTTNLQEAVQDADLIVESVTSKGIRPVFSQLKELKLPDCPIILTSKGIEQDTGLILPEVALETLGENFKSRLGLISGPSFATEVIRGLPTSVVVTAWEKEVMEKAKEAFNTEVFRVYPNSDMIGVAYGGALKNIIAIACGISDGLELGFSSKAALITRGLHEITKLTLASGGKRETISGLSGLGDVVLTAGSLISRNFKFGHLLAKGDTPDVAKKKIGMVVEGAYTAVSALQISKELDVDMPITEIVWRIIYENMDPKDAVKALMLRSIKEEHL